MARERKTCTPEFDLPAVRKVLGQKRSVTEAARQLGIGANLLHLWRKAVLAHGPQALPGSGPLTPQEEELRPLREEHARLKMERDTLKEATAFFATQSN
jgi:transposase